MRTNGEILNDVIDAESKSIPKAMRSDFRSKRECPDRTLALKAMMELRGKINLIANVYCGKFDPSTLAKLSREEIIEHIDEFHDWLGNFN